MAKRNQESNAASSALNVRAAGAELEHFLDGIFRQLHGDAARTTHGTDSNRQVLFPNGVTNLDLELSVGSVGGVPTFSAKVQVIGPAANSIRLSYSDQLNELNRMAATPVRFRIRRFTNVPLDESRADVILSGGMELLRTVDGPDDVSCAVDLGRDGTIQNFSIGNGIISSQADYNAVCGESNHAHRIYLVNQILYCGGFHPQPGFAYIGCSDTPGSCMMPVRGQERHCDPPAVCDPAARPRPPCVQAGYTGGRCGS